MLTGASWPKMDWSTETMGIRSWFFPDGSASRQRGYAEPQAAAQHRWPPWQMHGPYGGVIQVHTRQYSRGAAGFVPNFGKVFESPIGAGIVTPFRPQPSYGLSGQYLDHTIFWAYNTVPTSIPLGPLTSPEVMAALLGTTNVQAAVRVG